MEDINVSLDLVVAGVIVLTLFGCWKLLQYEIQERRFRQVRDAAVKTAAKHMLQEAHEAEVPHRKPRYRSPEVEQRFF
jgi:hypothetical protein